MYQHDWIFCETYYPGNPRTRYFLAAFPVDKIPEMFSGFTELFSRPDFIQTKFEGKRTGMIVEMQRLAPDIALEGAMN